MDGKMGRFKKRREIIERKDYQPIDIPGQENDKKFIEHMISKKYQFDFTVTSDEVEDFLEKFKKDFNDQRFKRLVTDCQKEVINNIVIPFGLGKIVAAYDKTGGNVDTIHNVRNDIFATDAEREKYQEREDYSSNKKLKKGYHSGNKNYKEKSDEYKDQQAKGNLEDAYNGKKFSEDDNVQVEHVISTEEIHNDAGRILSEQDGTTLANKDSNLKPVIQSVNGSKQNDTATKFLKRVERNKEKIKVLEAKDELTSEEKQGLERLNRVTDVDKEKVKQLDTEARKEYNDKINKEYYCSKKFAKNTATAGAKEGVKMGMQQAIGLVLVEFFTALFDEIIDIYKNGFDNGFKEDKFLSILASRLRRIGERIASKWKDVAIAFKDGAISGFISNMVTTLINTFATTAKSTVRIIREGIFSLYRAVKLLLFPPEGMTFSDAMHEAKKLIASGIIISIGVAIEQYVDSVIKTMVFLEPFADIVTSILIGSITGLTVILVAYYIDKKKNDKDLFNNLVCDTDKKLEAFNKLLLFDNAIPEVSKVLIST